MDILVLLVPCAMSLGALALAAFFWSLSAKQYEDLDGAAVRILMDDDAQPMAAPQVDHGTDRP